MLKQILLPLALVTLAALTSASCAGPRYGAGVRFSYGPPPPPRYGMVGYAPARGYIWCDGYWDRAPRGWAWVPGSWQRPPRPRAAWVPGGWYSHRGDYRFRGGYWR